MPIPDIADDSFLVEAVPELRFVDVFQSEASPEVRAAQLEALGAVHVRHFPDRMYSFGEWVAILSEPRVRAPVLHYAWLVLRDGVPVGEFVMDSNLLRETVLIHYVALDKEVRRTLNSDWLARALNGLIEIMTAEAQQLGVTLAIAIAESDEAHGWHWQKMEWIPLDVNYREPKYGMHWSDFGQPSFVPLVVFVRFLKPGSEEERKFAAVQSLKAFLVDNYALNENEPTVLEICALAQSITL
jgi:hypothetical protein